MHARSTTFLSSPDRLDAGMALVRDEVMPALMAMDGCLGMSVMLERDSGRCIATTSWASEDAMRASADAVMPMRRRAAEVLGGDMTVAEWEIALLHRMHNSGDGAWVRCTWVHAEADRIDGAVDMFRRSMPELDGIDGFCGASMFVSRDTGITVASTSWADRSAIDSTREGAATRRQRIVDSVGLDILEVAEFELVMAHLRVPEMA